MNTSEKPKDSPHGTVEFLLLRMQRSGDFPGLSDSIRTINQITEAKHKSLDDLASAVVQDFALTQKILKIVNSAYYGRFAGKIGTITRAIVVLGVEPIRALAASLMFFEHLSDRAHADRVRDRIGTAMFQAVLARQTAIETGFDEIEEAFLAGMFHALGEVLVAYYLPEEDAAIATLMDEQGLSQSAAAQKVLGIGMEKLAIGVAEHWNLPGTITHSMKRLAPKPLDTPSTLEEHLRHIANFSAEMTDLLVAGDAGDPEKVKALRQRYSDSFSIGENLLDSVLGEARSSYRKLARSILKPGNTTSRLQQLAAPPKNAEADVQEEAALDAIDPDTRTNDDPTDPESILVAGLQEVTTSLAEQANVNQIANLVLETLFRAFGLHRVSLCLRDPGRQQYVARIAFGQDSQQFSKVFRFDEAYAADAFHAALKNKRDKSSVIGFHFRPCFQ